MPQTQKRRDNNDRAESNRDLIYFVDENLAAGFAKMPRMVLKAKGLSDKAKLVYELLLDYAWQKGSCFPGQLKLADDLDSTVRTIQRALNELRDYKLISWKRRGVTQTNIYYILRLSDCPFLKDTKSKEVPASDVTKMSYQDQTKMSPHDATKMSHKEYVVEEHEFKTSNSNRNKLRLQPEAIKRPRSGFTNIGDLLPMEPGGIDRDKAVRMSLEGSRGRLEAAKRQESENGTSWKTPVNLAPVRTSSLPIMSPDEEARLYTVITDVSAQLGDSKHVRSNKSQAINILKQRPGLRVAEFIDAVYLCLGLTKELKAGGTIRSSAMAYLFATLRERLNLPRSNTPVASVDRATRSRSSPKV